MALALWTYNGGIVIDDGGVVICDTCPCDEDAGDYPDYCASEKTPTIPAAVLDNPYTHSGFMNGEPTFTNPSGISIYYDSAFGAWYIDNGLTWWRGQMDRNDGPAGDYEEDGPGTSEITITAGPCT